MRWYLASGIGLWFIFISLGSSLPSSDMCSSIMNQFPSVNTDFSLSVTDIITMVTDCYCKITADPPVVCLFYSCLPCPSGSQSSSRPCLCSLDSFNLNPSCLTTHANRNNPPGNDKIYMYSCHILTNLTTALLLNPSNGCSIGSYAADLVFVIQLKATDLISGILEPVRREVICNATSVTPDASSTTVAPVSTTAASSKTVASTSRNHLSDTTEYQPYIASTPTRETIIGIAVGVGGGVPLIIVIVIIIVVLRRRRSESNKLDACALSQTTAVIPSETAYASYTIPVSAAYDNATNGTTSNYESLADYNEEVDDSNHAYTEVKEISDHNGYDNSKMGRSDAYSMCKETGKNYEIVSENPTANTESETTVIDNEFYG